MTMNQSGKATKDTGTCFFCWRNFKLQKKDGTLHKHGHGGPSDEPCPGRYNIPSSTRRTTAAASSSQTRRPSTITNASLAITSHNPSQSISANDVTGSLKHPLWIPLITRIQKAARSACTSALSKILKSIITDPTQLEAWNSLFSFVPTVLATPTRGGSNRNLANAVLKNLIGCDDVPSS